MSEGTIIFWYFRRSKRSTKGTKVTLKAGETEISFQAKTVNELVSFFSFQTFLAMHKKTYAGGKQEYLKRFEIFQANLKLVKQIQKNEKGQSVSDATTSTKSHEIMRYSTKNALLLLIQL